MEPLRRDAGHSPIILAKVSHRILQRVARTEVQFAPMGRSNIEMARGVRVDPTGIGEATSTDENVRFPLDNADFDVVIAWHCRDGPPFHMNSSCAA